MQGRIKTLNYDKKFGFIRPDSDKNEDVFFHQSALINQPFAELTKDLKVEFDLTTSSKGPRAENVRILE